jgi:hypothetical protein
VSVVDTLRFGSQPKQQLKSTTLPAVKYAAAFTKISGAFIGYYDRSFR